MGAVKAHKNRWKLAVLLGAGLLGFLTTGKSPRGSRAVADSSPLPIAVQDYKADFSDGRTKGMGLRFTHLPSSLYVDMRLKGFAKRDASRTGQRYEFDSGNGVNLTYLSGNSHVKETILLDQPSPADFRFTLEAPGLEANLRNGEVFLSPPGQTWMFRLGKVSATDADGKNIPATLSLRDQEVAIRLDREALSRARAPIAIDPAIEGAPVGTFVGAHSRKLFRLDDGRLILFLRQGVDDNPKVVYRISSDSGANWDAPVVIGDSGPSGEVTAVQTLSGSFVIAYSAGTQDLPKIMFRRLGVTRNLTEQGETTTFELGPERLVTTGAIWWKPYLTVADRGSGPLGHRYAVGFSRYNPVFSRLEAQVAFSEDSGATWLPTTCATDAGASVLAVQDDRILCITARWDGQGLDWRTWDGLTWGTAGRVTTFQFTGLDMPSITWTADGRLHLTAETFDGNVFYTSLETGASQWTTPEWLGRGWSPTISTGGIDLEVNAHESLSTMESLLRSWAKEDDGPWVPGSSRGGRALTHVLDHNQTWAFVDQPQTGDTLFSIADSNLPNGWIGNRIGTSLPLHSLDSASKKLSFGFKPQNGGAVTEIKVWASATAAPAYRVGLQSDSGGIPNGWLPGDDDGLPAFVDITFNSSTVALKSIPVRKTTLSPSTRYHLVVEPVSSQGIGPSNYAAIESVGSDPQASFSFDVLTKDGAAAWDPVEGEVPRVVLSGPSGVIFSQKIIPRPYIYGAMEYVVTGESFVPSQNITPTQIRLHLIKSGDPTAATVRLFNSSDTQLWSATAYPTSSGWVDLVISGVTLASGQRYRLLVDHDSRDTNNYWALQPSGAGALSWGGTSDALTSSHSRPGFSDRSAESSDNRIDPWFRDFVAFDSSASDALYLGDSQPFGLATMVRLVTDGGGAVPTSWTYWNGTTWTPLTLTQNEFLGAGLGGYSKWAPPLDWAQTTMDGKLAYWVKVVSTSGTPTSVLVQRATAIGDRRYASVIGTTGRPSSGRLADQP